MTSNAHPLIFNNLTLHEFLFFGDEQRAFSAAFQFDCSSVRGSVYLERICLFLCMSVCLFLCSLVYARPQFSADLHQIWHVTSLYRPNSLPKSHANCDFCRHFLLMLNFYVYKVLQGIWNRSRYDVAVSRSFQGHGKVKSQMSALANVCSKNAILIAVFSINLG